MKLELNDALTAGARLSLSLILVMALAFAGACAHSRSLIIGAPEAVPTEDAFPRIKKRTTHSLRVQEGGFTVRVHYGAGENERAREAAQLLQRPIRFLRDTTRLNPDGRVEAYLYPLLPGEEPPHFQAHGRGDFTFVLFISNEPLLKNPHNRLRYDVLTHELVHSFLSSLPLGDRWLEDGLAEYLRAEFAKVYEEEFPTSRASFPTRADWLPPLEAFRRTAWGPWSHKETNKLLGLRKKDPAYAAYLLDQEAWKYSAAEEMVRRWMEAVKVSGVENPVADLLSELSERNARVKWEDTRHFIQTQTGQQFEKLVEVTEKEKTATKTRAWNNRLSEKYSERVRALRTLQFLGLPAGASASDLLDSFDLPEHTPAGPYVEQALALAATGAVASGGDAQTARKALELLRRRQLEELSLYLVPEILGLVAELDRQQALTELVKIMIEPKVGLGIRERANVILEELTESTTGWSVDLPPDGRKTAASQWVELVRTKEGVPTMTRLMRFPTSVKREPSIEAWMEEQFEELGPIARYWFEALRGCGDDVRELLHDGHPTACVGDAAFAYVNAFRAHVNVGFFRGAELPDPKGLLEGTGKRMRHVKLRPGEDVDGAALLELIQTAYKDMKVRCKVL